MKPSLAVIAAASVGGLALLVAMTAAFRSAPKLTPYREAEMVRVTPREPPPQAASAPAPARPAPRVSRDDVTGSIPQNLPPSDQKARAASCGDDPDCLGRWFGEYRDMVTGELQFWRGFEDHVAEESRAGALADLKAATDQGRYRHQSYDYFRGVSIREVKRDDLTALIDDCRAAIVNMKFMLMAVGRGSSLDDGSAGHYVRNARNCEKQFKLPPYRSALRQTNGTQR